MRSNSGASGKLIGTGILSSIYELLEGPLSAPVSDSKYGPQGAPQIVSYNQRDVQDCRLQGVLPLFLVNDIWLLSNMLVFQGWMSPVYLKIFSFHSPICITCLVYPKFCCLEWRFVLSMSHSSLFPFKGKKSANISVISVDSDPYETVGSRYGPKAIHWLQWRPWTRTHQSCPDSGLCEPHSRFPSLTQVFRLRWWLEAHHSSHPNTW